MPTRIRRTRRRARRANRAPERRPPRETSPNSRSSSSAKRVLDPRDLVRPARVALNRDHVESHDAALPGRTRVQQEARGANELAPLGYTHRGEGTAEVGARVLAHFDDNKRRSLAAHEVYLARLAAHVAREQLQTTRREIVRREVFGALAFASRE